MVDEVVAIPAFDAKTHAVHPRLVPKLRLRTSGDADDAVVPDVQIEAATHAAVGASGRDNAVWLAKTDGHLVIERTGRAVGDAGPARFAARVKQGRVGAGDDCCLRAPFGHSPNESALYFLTCTDATRTQDAL